MKKVITQTITLDDKEVREILRELIAKKLNVDPSQLTHSFTVSPGYSDMRDSSPASFNVTFSFKNTIDV